MSEPRNLRLLIPVLLAFTACASMTGGPKPSNVTLEQAMASVATGFKALRAAEGDMRLGMIPSEIEVTFNVTAAAEDAGKLVLDLAPVAKIGGEAGSKLTTQRGNQITIKFTSLFLMNDQTLLTKKNAAEWNDLMAIIAKHGAAALTR